MKPAELLTDEEVNEECSLVNFRFIKDVLSMSGSDESARKFDDILWSTVRLINNEYGEDEMPRDLERYVSKILYLNNLCEKVHGRKFVNKYISLTEAEESMVHLYNAHTLVSAIGHAENFIR